MYQPEKVIRILAKDSMPPQFLHMRRGLQSETRASQRNAKAYGPFVKYMLGVVVAAYRDFSDRVETSITGGRYTKYVWNNGPAFHGINDTLINKQ